MLKTYINKSMEVCSRLVILKIPLSTRTARRCSVS